MTAHDNSVVTALDPGPGAGGLGSPLFFGGGRVMRGRSFSVNFGTHYPVAGVDVSAFWEGFAEVKQIIPDSIDGFLIVPDYDNQKLILFKAIGTEQDDDTDQSGVDANCIVVGYPGTASS